MAPLKSPLPEPRIRQSRLPTSAWSSGKTATNLIVRIPFFTNVDEASCLGDLLGPREGVVLVVEPLLPD